ncbi:MAG: hypothetical protein JEZ14_07465 [Marinilabiliaceae bacterium]|nr:hypothetical protein [Marinilabiliaceae bacterium]
MKIVTRKKQTLYFPMHLNKEGQSLHYKDKQGKDVTFKRMEAAERFIKQQKEEMRFVVKSVTQNTVYR